MRMNAKKKEKTRRETTAIKVWVTAGRESCDHRPSLTTSKSAGVKIRSLTEAIDTETPTGRAMWQMIGLMAEFERSIISERTPE
jgi:DNA invertase Pin-like site-specific DNA recombinase